MSEEGRSTPEKTGHRQSSEGRGVSTGSGHQAAEGRTPGSNRAFQATRGLVPPRLDPGNPRSHSSSRKAGHQGPGSLQAKAYASFPGSFPLPASWAWEGQLGLEFGPAVEERKPRGFAKCSGCASSGRRLPVILQPNARCAKPAGRQAPVTAPCTTHTWHTKPAVPLEKGGKQLLNTGRCLIKLLQKI